jgi:hypothetical protein
LKECQVLLRKEQETGFVRVQDVLHKPRHDLRYTRVHFSRPYRLMK